MRNLILMCDSQKIAGHNLLGSHDGVQFHMRAKKDIVYFGLQAFLLNYLLAPIEQKDIDDAKLILKARGQLKAFNIDRWQRIVDKFDGHLPITIRAVDEGSTVKAGVPFLVVNIWDKEFAWLAYHFDSIIMRAIWYPSTLMTRLSELQCELNRLGVIEPVMLYDLSNRIGTSSESSAIIGACVRTIFPTSDSLSGDLYLQNNYCQTLSQPAKWYGTEHNIIMGWESEEVYLEKIKSIPSNSSISCLIDTYNANHCLKLITSDAVQSLLVKNNITAFISPDSVQDVSETIRTLGILLRATNQRTLLPKHFRVIQEGITINSLRTIYDKLAKHNYDIGNLVYSLKDELLQHDISRDTYGFEFKMNAYKKQSAWIGSQKRPENQPERWSIKGYVSDDNMSVRYMNGNISNTVTMPDIVKSISDPMR